MHLFYCFCLVINLALGQQVNNPPFKIAVTEENSTVVAGAEISINVSLTNTSNHDVYEGVMYGRGNIASIYRFEVRDEHGKLVSKRTYPHPEVGFPGSVRFSTISPGQTVTEQQEVSAIYDMRKPGKYTIQVSRRLSENPKDDIKSNIVTITVTTKDKDQARKSGKARNQ